MSHTPYPSHLLSELPITIESDAGAAEPVEAISELIEKGNAPALTDQLRDLPPADTPRTISSLKDEDQRSLWEHVIDHDPVLAADLLDQFADDHAAQMVSELSHDRAARLLNEVGSDQQADVVQRLDDDHAESILDRMSPEEAADIRLRLAFDDSTAAGVMITEFIAFNEDRTVAEVIENLRAHYDLYGAYEARYLFALDDEGRLAGVIRLRALLLAAPDAPLVSLRVEDFPIVEMDTKIEDLERLFDRINHKSVPVVDHDRRLLGVVQRAHVEEVLSERATSSLMKFGGILGGEELRSMPTMSRSTRRLAFLLPSVLLSFTAVSVIALFEPLIAEVTALAVILPVVANLSGAAGNQAVAVSIRELTLGLIHEHDVIRVWRKEVAVGALNGLVIGGLLGGVVFVTRHEPVLALVVAVAYSVSSVAAVTLGGALPLILRRAGVDPAMLSSPVLTTLTDMCSFFLVLSLAAVTLTGLSSSP